MTVSLAKNRECGREWIFDKKADFYLSSSFFKNITVCKNFDEVKYKSGVAIIYTTTDKALRARLDDIFLSADWSEFSSVATNGCRHIGKSHIFQLLEKRGFENVY